MPDDVVRPDHPHYCRHGRQVGWHSLDDPDVIVSTRFCAPCSDCSAQQPQHEDDDQRQ